jgi:hypothetical protein
MSGLSHSVKVVVILVVVAISHAQSNRVFVHIPPNAHGHDAKR